MLSHPGHHRCHPSPGHHRCHPTLVTTDATPALAALRAPPAEHPDPVFGSTSPSSPAEFRTPGRFLPQTQQRLRAAFSAPNHPSSGHPRCSWETPQRPSAALLSTLSTGKRALCPWIQISHPKSIQSEVCPSPQPKDRRAKDRAAGLWPRLRPQGQQSELQARVWNLPWERHQEPPRE